MTYTASSRAAAIRLAWRWKFGSRGNPHRLTKKLVVSLTSYPARYATLHLTLQSLLRQTMKADHTILWVGKADFAALPKKVLDLQSHGLEIRATDDKRSYTKIIPTLDSSPDAYICTADDDIYYFGTWLEELVSGVEQDSHVVPCHRVHTIALSGDGTYAPYDQWIFNIARRGKDKAFFPTGVGGILYPPHILAHTPEDRDVAYTLCPYADDVWLYWIGRRNGAIYKTIGKRRELITWKGSQDQCLWQDNVGGGRNDEQIRKIAKKYGYPDITS